MDFIELASFLPMIYSSGILYYLAYRFRRRGKSLAYLSIILGLTLMMHGIHHLGEFLGNDAIDDLFGLSSAILAVVLGVVYSYLR